MKKCKVNGSKGMSKRIYAPLIRLRHMALYKCVLTD